MLHYVNGFSCAMDNEREDFIIHFVQRIPKVGDEGMEEEMITENISSLVMGKNVAEKLLSALQEMLNIEE